MTPPPPGVLAYDAAHARFVLAGNGTWVFGTFLPPGARTVGSGCHGTNGPPHLTSNEPYLGNPSFRLQVGSARPWSPCLFAFAAQPDNLVLGGGCTLYLKAPIVPFLSVTDALGFVETHSLAIPLDITLRGAPLYAQACVADPQGPVFGLAFSAGRKLVLGD